MDDIIDAETGEVVNDYAVDVQPETGAEGMQASPGSDGEKPDVSEGEISLDTPILAIKGEDGIERQLTGKDIMAELDRLAELTETNKTLEEQNKALGAKKTESQPASQPKGEGSGDVDYAGMGQRFISMLEGENGGPEALGPALRDMIRYEAHKLVGEMNTQQSAADKFYQEFPDYNEALESGKAQSILTENPLYNPLEAYLVATIRDLRGQLQGKVDAGDVEAAKKAGAKEAQQHLKAKGNIRVLQGGGYRPPGSGDPGDKYNLKDPDERSKAMLEGLKRMRGGS